MWPGVVAAMAPTMRLRNELVPDQQKTAGNVLLPACLIAILARASGDKRVLTMRMTHAQRM